MGLRKRQILHRHLRYTGWYIKLISFLKHIRLRKGKASLYRIAIIFIDKVLDNQVLEKAYGVAFNFTLAVFPSVIFLFALIPFLHTWIPTISQAEILSFMSEVMPENVYLASEQTIKNTVQIRRGRSHLIWCLVCTFSRYEWSKLTHESFQCLVQDE